MEQKRAARECKDLLALCLAKGMEQALFAYMGPQWFACLLAEDLLQEPKKQILKNGQQSIQDLDLQALLKILRYRESFADAVLSYYGFLSADDPFSNQGQLRQLRGLLDRLITEFRNSMEAHTRVADIEQGEELQRLYGYEEAMQDMEKLSGIFKTIKDSKGVSYHSRIAELRKNAAEKKKRRLPLVIACVVAALLVAGAAVGGFLYWKGQKAEEKPATVKTPPKTGNVFYLPNNISFEQDKVSIRPKHVYYEDGDLVAVCFVLNGLDEPVSNISVEKIVISNDEGRICGAAFGALDGVTLQPKGYEEWTFRFPEELVDVQDADLSDLTFSNRCKFAH